ncbi:MAG: FAD-dependent monooxygenase [Candidatus Njordarchaeia archaeon]
MKKHEILVAGGGTIGSFFALSMAKRGFQVSVYEDNRELGLPQHCSGLISIRGLERIGVWNWVVNNGLVLNYVKNARFYGVSGNYREISLPSPIAVVIDRVSYDKMLGDKAQDRGAEYHFAKRVKKLSLDGVAKIGDNGGSSEVKAQVLVDAEGAGRKLIKDLPGVNRKGLLPSIQMDIEAKRDIVPLDTVELHFNVDDFFSWIIPLSEIKPVYRVGFSSTSLQGNRLAFLKHFARTRLGQYKILRKFGGLVVSYGPLKRFVWGPIIAIGDAAGHVKPTTGGGVVLGSIGAHIAAEAVARHLNLSEPLNSYQKRYMELLGQQFRFMLFVRRVLNFLNRGGVDAMLRLFPQIVFSNIRGDMDFQLEAILKLMFPILNFIRR